MKYAFFTKTFEPAHDKTYSKCVSCVGFNDMSNLVGHVVLSPREREKRDEEIVEEMKERDREEKGK